MLFNLLITKHNQKKWESDSFAVNTRKESLKEDKKNPFVLINSRNFVVLSGMQYFEVKEGTEYVLFIIVKFEKTRLLLSWINC